MSPGTVELVRTSWSAIMPRRKEVGVSFYRRLFEVHPEVQPLFKGDIDRQTALFTTMINTVVSALENPKPVRPLIELLGARHADYGVSATDYDKFEQVFLDTLEEALGDKFTADTRAAWRQVYEGMAATMQRGAGEGRIR